MMADITHIGGHIPVLDDTNDVSWQKCKDCRWLIQVPMQDTGVRLSCLITGNEFTLKECIKGGEGE